MRRRGFLKRLGVVGATAAGSRLLAPPRAADAARANAAAGLARLKRWPASLQARVARYEGGRLAGELRVALEPGGDGARRPRRRGLDLRAARAAGQGAAGRDRSAGDLPPGQGHRQRRQRRRRAGAGRLVEEPLRVAARRLLQRQPLRVAAHRLPGAADRAGRHRAQRPDHHLGHPAPRRPRRAVAHRAAGRRSDHARRRGLVAARRRGAAAADRPDDAARRRRDQRRRGRRRRRRRGRRPRPRARRERRTATRDAAARARATLLVTAPGVRETHRYALGNTRARSHDPGALFIPGSELVLRLRLYQFACPELQGLFDRFVAVRKDLSGPTRLRHTLPFSSAAQMHEEKYNRDNWLEKPGFYATTVSPAGGGERTAAGPVWQTGWGGGLVATHPLLFGGDPRTRERVLRTFDFVFSGQLAAVSRRRARPAPVSFTPPATGAPGWTRARSRRRAPAGRPQLYKQARSWHLVRRSGDVLYFMLKQLALLERQDADVQAQGDLDRRPAGVRRRVRRAVGSEPPAGPVRQRRDRPAGRRRLDRGRDRAGRVGAGRARASRTTTTCASRSPPARRSTSASCAPV